MDISNYEKRGYLHEDFRFFYLKDYKQQDFDYHYHEFDKIVVFLSGKGSYIIEGKSYLLEPKDIIIVNHHDIHKPEIDYAEAYERVIFYISPAFLKQYKDNLMYCFEYAKTYDARVFRLHAAKRDRIFWVLKEIKTAAESNEYGKDTYMHALFLEFIIHLTRAAAGNDLDLTNQIHYDGKIIEIINYINANLKEKMTIDDIAERFYISKYHLMRKFKEETGYTIHNYIKSKRLLLAKEMLLNNSTVTDACYACGFSDYTAFLKAYKNMFHTTPREAHNQANHPAIE